MAPARSMPISSQAPAGGGPYPMGLLALVATVAMLFAAFTAALLMRRSGSDWVVVDLPPVVGVNTLLLIASSGAVEWARRAVRSGHPGLVPVWLVIGLVLGGMFLLGQLVAWRALVGAGVFLPTSPHASFFYMLTAVHGAHVLGGLAALAWVLRRSLGGAYTAESHRGLTHALIFWHFMGAIWLYVLALLTLS